MSARLLFVATWNFADDEGGLDRSAKQLKAQAFPYDQIDCEPLVQELLQAGLLIEYEVDGKKYLHIKGFGVHQKIEKKARARFPIYKESMRTPRGVGEESVSSAVSSLGREWKGREGKQDAHARARVVDVTGLDSKTWDRWTTYRTEIRKPLKPASIPAAQKALAAFGSDQAAVVEQSIAQGWTGLFQLNGQATVKPKYVPAPTTAELEAREVASGGH